MEGIHQTQILHPSNHLVNGSTGDLTSVNATFPSFKLSYSVHTPLISLSSWVDFTVLAWFLLESLFLAFGLRSS